jgi:hypothetical protein
MNAKNEITQLRKIAETIRIVWNSASFVRAAGSIQRTAKRNSLKE